MTANVYKVSSQDEKNVPKLESSDCCKTLEYT